MSRLILIAAGLLAITAPSGAAPHPAGMTGDSPGAAELNAALEHAMREGWLPPIDDAECDAHADVSRGVLARDRDYLLCVFVVLRRHRPTLGRRL